jgi:hypothetical protein
VPASTPLRSAVAYTALRPCRIRIGVNLRRLDVLSDLLLALMVRPKALIPILHRLLEIRHLVSSRVACHELWRAKRQLVSPVGLPEMVDLAIQVDDFLHFLVFGYLPYRLGNSRRLRHDEHARLDFEDMRVPQLLFFRVKGFVEFGGNHVLYNTA